MNQIEILIARDSEISDRWNELDRNLRRAIAIRTPVRRSNTIRNILSEMDLIGREICFRTRFELGGPDQWNC